MPQNFLPCDRDQEFLLPPSLRDWLPPDHLAWFVTETVDELELEPFYVSRIGLMGMAERRLIRR
jgi:hypothetical protein